MKTTKINSLMLAMLMILAAAGLSFAQDASKTINKDFKVNSDATLSVENSFGKIHCNVWDKNEIAIEVRVTATGRDSREAERLIEGISIDLKGNSNKVEAITTIRERLTTTGKTSISVDYTINMPRTINLLLTNKFGDIYVDENTGTSVINLDYGNLQINRLKGMNHRLNMRFSKGTLGSADNLRLEMSYSELSSKEVNDLVIESKFSTFEVESAGSIRQDSQYDTNRLGDSKSLKAIAKFSTISIVSISEVLDLDLRYGGCTVREIDPKFKEITINNSFGNVDLRFRPETSFRLDAESNFGGVSFPRNSNVNVEEVSFTGKTYKGVVGKESKPARTVTITTRNGDVSLKMN